MARKKRHNLPVVISKRNNNQVVNRNTIHYPTYSKPQLIQPTQVFRGNLAKNMRFGNPGDSLSGYVQREVIMIDRQGNKQIAREKQFFNSGKHFNVRIDKE